MVRCVKSFAMGIAAVLFAALIGGGCDTVDLAGLVVPTSDVVDERFEQSMALTKGVSVAEISTSSSYTFYVCSDPHIEGVDMPNLVLFADSLRNNPEAPFGVMLGDCIEKRGAMADYAATIAHRPESQLYQQPIFSLLGNHDTFFDGWDSFRDILGPSVYTFVAGDGTFADLFIALDSANGALGRKQYEWLEELLAEKRDEYRHCVVLTHTNIFYSDRSQNTSGNTPLDESMAMWELFSEYNVSLVLQGHDHFREDLTLGGVRYVVVPSILEGFKAAEWLRVTLSDQGVRLAWQPL